MIPGLDGLRAVAFLIVFAFHTRQLPFGWLGVQLFFVLSGFLITDILLRMKDRLGRRDFFIKFYGRRFLRIFPLYYFYLGLLGLMVVWLPSVHITGLSQELGRSFRSEIWYALLYIYDFFHASAWFERTRFFTHLWSLSVEEQFYVVWPLLIFLTPKKNFKWLCLTAIGLGPLLRLLITLIYRAQLFAFLSNDPQQSVNVLPFSHIDAFAMGAYISRFDLPRPRLQLALLCILTPACGLLADTLATGTAALDTLGYSLPLVGRLKEVWGYSLLNYLFAVLIYCVANRHLMLWLLDSKPFQYLGKISYGLYVYHYGMIALLAAVFDKYKLDYSLRSPQMFFGALISTVAIASLSYALLEKPIINLKDRFFRVSSA